MAATILIADDHALFRRGLRALLDQQKSLQVIAETADGPTTLAEATRLKPDVVLMDISMPGLNGIEVTRRIVAAGIPTRIVIISMHTSRRFVTEALKAGAMGYLQKDSTFEELRDALKYVLAGRIYLSRLIDDSVVRDYIAIARRSPESAFSVLSAREREVLQLLAEGKGTKETAGALRVSAKTIETHRKRIMEKLNAHSVAELTKYAIREGLTSLE
jgi:DNA-binding NarL/FixJ family response regulator